MSFSNVFRMSFSNVSSLEMNHGFIEYNISSHLIVVFFVCMHVRMCERCTGRIPSDCRNVLNIMNK